MMFLLPMTSPHRARFQDVPIHILAMHLYLLGNTNPYYPQPFQAIFGLCLQTTTHFFFHFLCSLSNDCVNNEIMPLQCRMLQYNYRNIRITTKDNVEGHGFAS